MPLNAGFLFSVKAETPSFRSSEDATTPKPSRSSANADSRLMSAPLLIDVARAAILELQTETSALVEGLETANCIRKKKHDWNSSVVQEFDKKKPSEEERRVCIGKMLKYLQSLVVRENS